MATSGWHKLVSGYLRSQVPARRELKIVTLCLVSTGLTLSMLATLAGQPAFDGWEIRSFFILFFCFTGLHFLAIALFALWKEHPKTGFWFLITWTFLLLSRLI